MNRNTINRKQKTSKNSNKPTLKQEKQIQKNEHKIYHQINFFTRTKAKTKEKYSPKLRKQNISLIPTPNTYESKHDKLKTKDFKIIEQTKP